MQEGGPTVVVPSISLTLQPIIVAQVDLTVLVVVFVVPPVVTVPRNVEVMQIDAD